MVSCYSSSSSLPLYTVALDVLFSWSHRLSLFLLSCSFSVFLWTFFACLARRDSQTDSLSSYTYLAPYTFRLGLGIDFDGPLQLLPLTFSPMPLFPVSSPGAPAGKLSIRTARVRHLHLYDVFEPVFVVIFPTPSSTLLDFKT